MKSKLNIVVIRDVKRIVFIAHRSYDADDRLTEERILDRKNGIDRRVQYAYDAAGNVLEGLFWERTGNVWRAALGMT